MDLDERDAAILDFESGHWRHVGSKETAIREAFDMTPARYYQVLNAVIDLPASVEHDPLLVKRLRRLREARARQRTARRLGGVLGVDG